MNDEVKLFSQEAEEAVLGSVMINPDAYHEAAVIIEDGSADFWNQRHQLIWQTYAALIKANTPIDFLTVTDALTDAGKLDEVGGASYVMGLLNRVPSSLHVEAYAEIVRRKAIRRRMLEAANRIAQLAYDDNVNEQEIISQAGHSIAKIAKPNKRRSISISDSVRETDALIVERGKLSTMPGIPTGLVDLDRLLGGGAQESDLILLSGRPGDGKTTLLLQIMNHTACYSELSTPRVVRHRVLMFSLEMPHQQLVMRLLAQLSGIDYQALRAGRIPEDKYTEYYAALDRLDSLDIIIDDSPAITPAYVSSTVKNHVADGGLDAIFLDSLNLMKPGIRIDHKFEVIDYCATELKNVARENNIPVWVAHQMNRGIEYRGNESRPTLADLREGGEQPADVVMFIYHDRADDKTINASSLIIAKQRNGPTGEIPIYFRANAFRFESAAKARL